METDEAPRLTEGLQVTKKVTFEVPAEGELIITAVVAPRSLIGGKLLGLGIFAAGLGGCTTFGSTAVPELLLFGPFVGIGGVALLLEGIRRNRNPWGLSTSKDKEVLIEYQRTEADGYRSVREAGFWIGEREIAPEAVNVLVLHEDLQGTTTWSTLTAMTSLGAIELFAPYPGPREDLREAADALAEALGVELLLE